MIALDVMGGDFAPHAILDGALRAARQSIAIALVGPEELIRVELGKRDASWEQLPLTIIHAPDFIAMDEEPVFAVRKKPDSSLVRAVASVKRGQCDTVISAGNSGALMAAAAFVLGRQPGVERPAIAGLLPARQGNVLALDLGANTECRPSYLVQFALMGSDFAKVSLGLTRPRVALLSNGHEVGKGSQLVKETFLLLEQSGLNFIGNIEPYDIFENKTDVLVCDGFSGNVLLKTMEATFDMSLSMLNDELEGEGSAIQAWGVGARERIENKLTHKKLGGAVLLGVQGNVIVCHGSSDARTLERALIFAHHSIKV